MRPTVTEVGTSFGGSSVLDQSCLKVGEGESAAIPGLVLGRRSAEEGK